jgi:hypothetical protein
VLRTWRILRERIFATGKARQRVMAGLWRGGATPAGVKRRRAKVRSSA